ncbi:hypothetical protein DV736_g2815, partial [Chaetothyriales sp. CBS 134916]
MSALWPHNARVTPSHVLIRVKSQPRALQALRGPPPPWASSIRTQYSAAQEAARTHQRPSVWHSIIPRSLREGIARRKPAEDRQPNSASYFIWIFLFIGSQAVRILGLKNEHKAYMRKADLKLAQLQEVVEKLHRGEEVDVEKALGTGDEAQELEWEEAMRELASEERRWQQSREKAREEQARQENEQARQENEQQDADPVNDTSEAAPPRTAPQAPGFY